MEFYRLVARQTTETEIREKITIDTISEIYPDIIVLGGEKNCFRIGSF